MDDGGLMWWAQAGSEHEYRTWADSHDNERGNSMKWTDTGGGDFEQPPVGTHPAYCVSIIDIGTQKGEYQGKATSKRQVIIGWELPQELMTEGEYAGKPFKVSKFYTASLGEKANLRKDLANWRGRDFTDEELRGFESKNILGKPCMLSLTKNDKGKTRVTGVMALPKSMASTLPAPANGLTYFSLERDEFKRETFEALSDGIKKMIQVSPEFQELTSAPRTALAGGTHFDDMGDDIPFATCAMERDPMFRRLRGLWSE